MHTGTEMRSAITLLTLVAAIAAEAPYHLPRPPAHAPAFHYPSAPAPPPPPPRPIPQFAPQPAPQPFIPNIGYQYQQPSIGQYQQQSIGQYQQPSIAPAFVQHAPAPAPAPLPIQYQPQPQQAYLPPISHPQPIAYPQPSQQQPISYQPPSTSYGIPQPNIVSRPILSQPQGQSIQLFNAPAPQPAPLPQPAPQLLQQPAQVYQPIAYPQQQFTAQQGYAYQQPQPQLQHISQVPLQAQPLINNAPVLSSYQADSNQYSSEQAQTHRDALDSVVVDRVQNIIKDDEHSSARNAGYLSLVSGVSLENAKPSVEISSFVHTSPLNIKQSSGSQRLPEASGTLASPSADYGLPSAAASSQSSQSAGSFLPQTQPATSYGPPN